MPNGHMMPDAEMKKKKMMAMRRMKGKKSMPHESEMKEAVEKASMT